MSVFHAEALSDPKPETHPIPVTTTFTTEPFGKTQPPAALDRLHN
jgi:hypothetical protein